jgi:3-oxoacyl-[acyl-carrier protein] reductase
VSELASGPSTRGRVALVTGCGKRDGMGQGIAHWLAASGYAVVVTDLEKAGVLNTRQERAGVPERNRWDGLDELVAEIRAAGGTVESALGDISDPDDAQRMVDTAVEAFGRLDVLVNNAGLGGSTSVLEMTDEQWSKVLDVTLTGTFRCTRAALQVMAEQRSGVIVNNASVIGWRAQKDQAHYAAAKAGVMALTRCSALDVAHLGIRVNAVAPSIAAHPYLAKVTTEELLGELASQEAFGRAAEPWEVATVIAFLASDYSGYMTGEIVSVSSQHP